jgi:Ca-activated chloride channel homolog
MTFRPLVPLALIVMAVLVLTTGAVVAMASARSLRTRLSWLLRIVMVLSLAVVVAQPSTGAPVPLTEEVTNADVLVVVDRTGSMAAEDWNGSQPRFDGVRDDLATLVDALPGVRWSVLAWDSEPVRTLPFTTDAEALTSWAGGLRQEITDYSSGSTITRPAEQVAHILSQDKERHPEKRRILVIISDGETTSDDPGGSYAEVASLVDAGIVLGYGTDAGGQMHAYDGSVDMDPNAPWITDPSGSPAVSTIDEAALRAVAGQLGLPYLHRTDPDPSALDAWAKALEISPETVLAKETTAWLAVTWPAAALLVLAGAGEVALTEQGLFRRRRTHD